MTLGVYFDVGGELNVHFTDEVKYEKVTFEDTILLVLRYKRRGEQTWTIMPVANITYITES